MKSRKEEDLLYSVLCLDSGSKGGGGALKVLSVLAVKNLRSKLLDKLLNHSTSDSSTQEDATAAAGVDGGVHLHHRILAWQNE